MFIEDLLDKVDEIKNSDGSGNGPRTRSAFAAVIVGGVVGMMVGYSKKWNLFYSAFTGAFIGGVAGALFVPKAKK